MILTVAFWALLFLVEKNEGGGSLMERNLYESDPIRHPYAAAVTLIFTVALMTCTFCNIRQCSDIRACRWKYGYRQMAKTDSGGQRTCVRRVV